jgi:predicted transcriptional regulator
MDDRYRRGRGFSCFGHLAGRCDDDVDRKLDQLGSKSREPLGLALGRTVHDGDGLTVDVAEVSQSLAEGLREGNSPGHREIPDCGDLR